MVTWDDHGILCREYLPETEEFDPSQLKIMNYGLYLTDNNWETARAGIGRFTLYNPRTQKDEEVYGVVADTVKGRIILGEDVYFANEANSFSFDENGLNITNGTNTVTLDLSATNLLNIAKGSSQLLYLDDSGNLNLTGSITANSGYIGGENGWAITSGAIYNGTDSMSSTEIGTYIGVGGIRQYADDDAFINMQSGILTAKGVNLTGAINATSGSFTGTVTATSGSFTGTITANDGYIGGTNGWAIASQKLSSGTLGSNNSMFLGTADLGSATIAGTALSTWRFTVGSAFGVTNAGAIYSTSGKIGGWTIGTNALYNGTNSMSSTTAGTYIGQSGFRQYASANAYINMQNGVLTAKGANLNNATIVNGSIQITTASSGNDVIQLKGPNAHTYMDTEQVFLSTNDYEMESWLKPSGLGLRINEEVDAVFTTYYDSSQQYWSTNLSLRQYNNGGVGTSGLLGIYMAAAKPYGGEIFIYPPGSDTQCAIGMSGKNRVIGLYNSSNTQVITLEASTGYVWGSAFKQYSDRNAKRNIAPLDKQKSAQFIYSQEAVSYWYEDFDTGEHHGMVAQDVEQAIKKVYGDSQWTIVTNPKENIENGKNRFKSLAYTEFIADIIATLQTQNERLIAIEAKIN